MTLSRTDPESSPSPHFKLIVQWGIYKDNDSALSWSGLPQKQTMRQGMKPVLMIPGYNHREVEEWDGKGKATKKRCIIDKVAPSVGNWSPAPLETSRRLVDCASESSQLRDRRAGKALLTPAHHWLRAASGALGHPQGPGGQSQLPTQMSPTQSQEEAPHIILHLCRHENILEGWANTNHRLQRSHRVRA